MLLLEQGVFCSGPGLECEQLCMDNVQTADLALTSGHAKVHLCWFSS